MGVIDAANKPDDAPGQAWATPGGRVGELLGTALGALSLLTFISLWTFSATDISLSASSTLPTENAIGPVGAYTADVLLQAFGLGAYFFAFLLAVASYRAWAGEPFVPKLSELSGATLIACAGSVLLYLGVRAEKAPFPYGGVVGALLGAQSSTYLGQVGTGILAVSLFMMGITLLTGGTGPRVVGRLARLRHRTGFETIRPGGQDPAEILNAEDESTSRPAKVLSSFRTVCRAKLARPRQVFATKDASLVGACASALTVSALEVGPDADAETISLGAPDAAALPHHLGPEADAEMSLAFGALDKSPWTISDKHIGEARGDGALEEVTFEDASVGLGASEGFEARFGGVIEHREPLLMNAASLPPPPPEEVDWPPVELSDVSPPRSQDISHDTLPAPSPLPSLDLLSGPAEVFSRPEPDWVEQKLRVLEAMLEAAALPTYLAVSEHGPALMFVRASPARPSLDVVGHARSLGAFFTESQGTLGIRVVVTPSEPHPLVTLEVPVPAPRGPCLRACLAQIADLTEPTRVTFGTDVHGEAASFDLATSGAVLLAGARQTGKTSALRALVTSLAFRATPEQVQLILIACDEGALSCFAGLPHLALPLVTDARRAAQALRWVLNEAEDRYTNLTSGTSDGEDTAEAFAQIVVIIDELAPLMQAVPSDIESFASRIAPIGRAVGVSLVAATHALNAQVVTGALKKHFSTRVAFRVEDRRAGRALLEEGGAELLLAAGDALFSAGSGQPAERRHCVLMTEAEAESVTAALKQTPIPEGPERTCASATSANFVSPEA